MTNKSANAFRTISEVATDLDVQKHVLRFWEGKFPQVKPMKRGGGRRYYRPEDIALLHGIRSLLHSDGYTIKGVQKILREQGVSYVKDHGRACTASDSNPGQRRPAKTASAASNNKSTRRQTHKATKTAQAGPGPGIADKAVTPDQAARKLAQLQTILTQELTKAQHDALAAVIVQLEDCRALLQRNSAPGDSTGASEPLTSMRQGKQA